MHIELCRSPTKLKCALHARSASVQRSYASTCRHERIRLHKPTWVTGGTLACTSPLSLRRLIATNSPRLGVAAAVRGAQNWHKFGGGTLHTDADKLTVIALRSQVPAPAMLSRAGKIACRLSQTTLASACHAKFRCPPPDWPTALWDYAYCFVRLSCCHVADSRTRRSYPSTRSLLWGRHWLRRWRRALALPTSARATQAAGLTPLLGRGARGRRWVCACKPQ
eukprot:scaffold232_cov374-Prasinococcus_capsulatus_cf.AAC.7